MRPKSRATAALLLTLTISPPTGAMDFFNCGTQFAMFLNLNEEEAGKLVTETYWDLMEKLGKGQVSLATLEKMAKAENPFAVPDQEKTDLGSLQARMKQFEDLVRTKGWHTADNLTALRTSILSHLEQHRLHDEGLARAAANNERDLVIPLPRPNGMTESPDGRWIVSTNRASGAKEGSNWTMNLYDARTRTVSQLPGSTLKLGQPYFSRDGKYLLFGAPGLRLFVLPFQDGTVDWAAGKLTSDPNENFQWDYLKQGKDPNLVLSGHNTQYVFLYDLKQNTSVQLDTAPFHGPNESGFGGASEDLGFVPGTNDIFIRTNVDSGTDRMRVFSLLPGGKLKLKETLWERKSPPGTDPDEKWERHTFFLPDATPVTSWSKLNEPGLTFYVGKEMKRIRMEFPADKFKPDRTSPNDGLVVHPTKPEAMLLYHNDIRSKYFVVHLDFATGKVMGSYELPGKSQSAHFSADGNHIFAEPWQKAMHFLNYRQHLAGEDQASQLNPRP